MDPKKPDLRAKQASEGDHVCITADKRRSPRPCLQMTPSGVTPMDVPPLDAQKHQVHPSMNTTQILSTPQPVQKVSQLSPSHQVTRSTPSKLQRHEEQTHSKAYPPTNVDNTSAPGTGTTNAPERSAHVVQLPSQGVPSTEFQALASYLAVKMKYLKDGIEQSNPIQPPSLPGASSSLTPFRLRDERDREMCLHIYNHFLDSLRELLVSNRGKNPSLSKKDCPAIPRAASSHGDDGLGQMKDQLRSFHKELDHNPGNTEVAATSHESPGETGMKNCNFPIDRSQEIANERMLVPSQSLPHHYKSPISSHRTAKQPIGTPDSHVNLGIHVLRSLENSALTQTKKASSSHDSSFHSEEVRGSEMKGSFMSSQNARSQKYEGKAMSLMKTSAATGKTSLPFPGTNISRSEDSLTAERNLSKKSQDRNLQQAICGSSAQVFREGKADYVPDPAPCKTTLDIKAPLTSTHMANPSGVFVEVPQQVTASNASTPNQCHMHSTAKKEEIPPSLLVEETTQNTSALFPRPENAKPPVMPHPLGSTANQLGKLSPQALQVSRAPITGHQTLQAQKTKQSMIFKNANIPSEKVNKLPAKPPKKSTPRQRSSARQNKNLAVANCGRSGGQPKTSVQRSATTLPAETIQVSETQEASAQTPTQMLQSPSAPILCYYPMVFYPRHAGSQVLTASQPQMTTSGHQHCGNNLPMGGIPIPSPSSVLPPQVGSNIVTHVPLQMASGQVVMVPASSYPTGLQQTRVPHTMNPQMAGRHMAAGQPLSGQYTAGSNLTRQIGTGNFLGGHINGQNQAVATHPIATPGIVSSLTGAFPAVSRPAFSLQNLPKPNAHIAHNPTPPGPIQGAKPTAAHTKPKPKSRKRKTPSDSARGGKVKTCKQRRKTGPNKIQSTKKSSSATDPRKDEATKEAALSSVSPRQVNGAALAAQTNITAPTLCPPASVEMTQYQLEELRKAIAPGSGKDTLVNYSTESHLQGQKGSTGVSHQEALTHGAHSHIIPAPSQELKGARMYPQSSQPRPQTSPPMAENLGSSEITKNCSSGGKRDNAERPVMTPVTDRKHLVHGNHFLDRSVVGGSGLDGVQKNRKASGDANENASTLETDVISTQEIEGPELGDFPELPDLFLTETGTMTNDLFDMTETSPPGWI